MTDQLIKWLPLLSCLGGFAAWVITKLKDLSDREDVCQKALAELRGQLLGEQATHSARVTELEKRILTMELSNQCLVPSWVKNEGFSIITMNAVAIQMLLVPVRLNMTKVSGKRFDEIPEFDPTFHQVAETLDELAARDGFACAANIKVHRDSELTWTLINVVAVSGDKTVTYVCYAVPEYSAFRKTITPNFYENPPLPLPPPTVFADPRAKG